MLQAMKKGFTLIELLVVITIIGILATGAVTTFTSQIQKARDTTRISDVGALKTSIEQAYQDTAQYPDATAAAFTGAIADYIEIIPSDPKEGQGCKIDTGGTDTTCYYAYNVGADSGIANGHYEISTAFEASGNLDNKAVTDSGNDAERLEQGTNLAVLSTEVPAGEAAGQCALSGGAGTALLVGDGCN